MVFSFFTESVLFGVPVASSNISSLVSSGPVSSANVGATQNLGNSINITGNLVVSENNVTRFVGVSSESHAVVYLNGSIEVTGNATLVLQHVTLYFMGSKAPYDRYIRLSNASNGHPRLIVTDAIIISYTAASFLVRPPTGRASASFGGAIIVYDGEIIGSGFAFYRQVTYTSYINLGEPTLIKSFGTTNVSLSDVRVDRIQSFDNANVSIIIGTGPSRIPGSSPSLPDKGIAFDVFNTSRVYLSRVTFNNVTLSDHAYMSLSTSTQVSGLAAILTKGFSKVDMLAGTKTYSGLAKTGYGGIIAAGNSSITVNSSIVSSGTKLLPILTAKENSTVSFGSNCTLLGKILTYNYSSVFINNPNSLNSLNSFTDLWFVERGFSHVYVLNSWFWTGVKTNEIQLFDHSGFSAFDSKFDYAWIQAYNDTSLDFSNSTIRGSELIIEGNVNMRITNGTSIKHALEMRDSSSLLINSSSFEIIFSTDSSRITLTNGNITSLSAKDASSLSSVNSTIDELFITSSDAVGSLANLTNFYKSSVLSFPGTSVQVNVADTYVNGLDLLFLGNSKVSISNSTITNLSLLGNSVANLTNLPSPVASLFLTGNARAYIWASLRVRSVDYFGNPLNNSTITITSGYSGTGKVLSQGVTGVDGWASFTIFSAFANATGKFPIGDITIQSSFSGVSRMARASLGFVNKDAVVSLPLPSWSGYILPGVVVLAIVVILALLSFVYGRIRRRK
jgi:hypothetical protein